jgi:hypothetical protein
MPTLDLSAFGFHRRVNVVGIVEAEWLGGFRLAFLFGANHKDGGMKRLNVLNACALIDAGVVG